MRMKTLVVLFILAWSLVPAIADVRIAIVSDPGEKDLAALLTTELSSNATISLVERDALEKIGDEAKLQQMAGTDATALGKLANADGLLFLDQRADGTHVRFTAVNLGYALFDDPVPPGVNPQQEAKALAHLVANDVPKLTLDRTKAVPLSVLNLRADFPTTDSTRLERALTLLLESRLAAVPEYVVVERRHAWSLGFERSLDPTTQPLLRGAYLIDGTISSSAARSCTVAVRLQNPGGNATAFSVTGKSDELSALANQILANIQKTIGGTSTAAPVESGQQEAAEYLDEGTWGRRAHANAAALEALDSAELLGAKPADVEVERIPVLYALADEGIEGWLPFFESQDKTPGLDPAALDQHTDAAIRSLREAALYQSEKMESQADPRLLADPTERFLVRTDNLLAWTVYRASKVLVLADRAKSPRADELRQALRPVTGYDPPQGKMGRAFTTNINNDNSRAEFADNWAQTLDEEMAYYRLACSDQTIALPFTTMGWRPDRFCERFHATPQECTKAFWDFVATLKDNPNSRLSYCLLCARAGDAATADSGYREFIESLWNMRAELGDPKVYGPLFHNVFTVPDDVKARNAAAGIPLIHYLLTQPRLEAWQMTLLVILWHPQGFPAADAPALWTDFNACWERAKAAGGVPGPYNMGTMADDFCAQFPKLAPTPQPAAPPADALTVTKFWSPGLAPGALPKNYQIIAMHICPDGAWIDGFYTFGECPSALFHVNLANFTSISLTPPDNFRAIDMGVADKALYLLDTSNADPAKHQLARYELPSGPWQVRPLPDIGSVRLYAVGDAPYLFTTSKERETSFVRYDWDADKWIVLASNRRRPAQNQFDDAPPIIFFGGIFAGPSHQPCAYVFNGTYFMHETPGTWSAVFDSAFGNQSSTIGDRTLIFSSSGEAVMLDANKPAPEYWVANSLPHVRQPAAPGRPPEKVLTPWAAQANWTWPTPPKGPPWKHGVAFHDETLFLLDQAAPGAPLEFVCYRKGDTTPRLIPLQFHIDDATRVRLSYLPETGRDIVRLSIAQIQHPERATTERMGLLPQLIATHQGLCLQYVDNGFWFIPFADIDAYLKTTK
jgi:hypothetical protein